MEISAATLRNVIGGAGGTRTLDLLTASQTLSQLSYSPHSFELYPILPLGVHNW